MDAADLDSFAKNRMEPDVVPVFRSDGDVTLARRLSRNAMLSRNRSTIRPVLKRQNLSPDQKA